MNNAISIKEVSMANTIEDDTEAGIGLGALCGLGCLGAGCGGGGVGLGCGGACGGGVCGGIC